MGACIGKSSNQTFIVRNINDERVLVQEGKMIVTPTDLIYIDSRNKEKWEWPLKFLRRYGCEGKVFSFEAGRKCISGEGLYAFVCEEANELFRLVARNISQGNQLAEQQATSNESPTDTALPLFPQKRTSVMQNGRDTVVCPVNVDAHPQQMHMGPKTSPTTVTPFDMVPPTTSPPPITGYTSIHFSDADHPPPVPNSQNRVNYSEIDLTKTAEFRRVRSASEVESQSAGMAVRRHTHAGAARNDTSSNGRRKHRRSREHRSPSSSSTSSVADPVPIKLEPCRERDEIPEHRKMSTTSLKNGNALYLNISVGESNLPSLATPSTDTTLNYQNVLVGTGDVSTAIPPQQDYQNVMVGAGSVAAALAVPNTPPSPVDQDGYPMYVPPATSTPTNHHHQQHRFVPASSSTPAPTSSGQSDYQNITPGPDVANSLANQSGQPSGNYLNITPGPNVALSYAEDREHPNYQNIDELQAPVMGNGNSSTLPLLRGAGAETMQTYAVLDIPSHTTRSHTMTGATSSYSWDGRNESSACRADSEENTVESIFSITDSSQRDRSLTTHSVRVVVADDKSNYTKLDFEKMTAIEALAKEVEQAKEFKKDQQHHKEHNTSSHKKKK